MQAQPLPAVPDPKKPATAGAAFDALFLREYPRLVAVAYRVLGDRAEAEDVAQEALWDFHRRYPQGLPRAGGWLHSAAVHTALNRLRGRRRRERTEFTHALHATPAPGPEHAYEQLEQRRLVREALRRLPERKAAVLALRYAGLSYSEVAAALGVGIGQVGTLLRRAEAQMLKEVNRGTSE